MARFDDEEANKHERQQEEKLEDWHEKCFKLKKMLLLLSDKMNTERQKERERVHLETLAANGQKQFIRKHPEWKKRARVARTAVCLGCGKRITHCKCSDRLRPHFMTQINQFGK